MKNRVETFNPPILRERGGRGEKGTETSTPTPYHTKDLGGKRKRGQRTPLTGNYSIINCYPETVVLPLCPTTKFPTKLDFLHAIPDKAKPSLLTLNLSNFGDQEKMKAASCPMH